MFDEQDTPRETFCTLKKGCALKLTNHSKLEKLLKNYFKCVVLPIKILYNMICEILKNAEISYIKDGKISNTNINFQELVKIIAKHLAVDEFGINFLKEIGYCAMDSNHGYQSI